MRLLFAVLAGCGGGDYCARSADLAAACGGEDDVKQCREDLESCTRDDLDRVDAWFACTEEAGALDCEPTPDQYIEGLDCLRELDGLSDACVLTLTQ